MNIILGVALLVIAMFTVVGILRMVANLGKPGRVSGGRAAYMVGTSMLWLAVYVVSALYMFGVFNG